MDAGLPGYCKNGIPVPRVLCQSRTEVTEVSGKGMRILQNTQKFRVRVRKSYRTSRSSGYRGAGMQSSQKIRVLWHGHLGLTEVRSGYKTCYTCSPGIVALALLKFVVVTRGKISGYGLYIPYRIQPCEVRFVCLRFLQQLRYLSMSKVYLFHIRVASCFTTTITVYTWYFFVYYFWC